MGFESRTLYADNDRIKLDVLVNGTKFDMLSMSYQKFGCDKEEYWDNNTWIVKTLHPAIWHVIFNPHLLTKEHREALSGIDTKDYLEMWGLLEQAKVLGWLEAE